MIEKFLSPPFIIIGMHRSGTSMLSGLLSASGIFMGNDLTSDKESRFFQQINRELFRQNHFSWINPGVPAVTAENRFHKTGMLVHYVRARSHPLQFLKLVTGNKWGWKDPRNTFTLDYWLRIFPAAKVIHIYRNGMDVALSLYYRNIRLGKGDKWYEDLLESKTTGFILWEKYIEQAFSYQSKLRDNMLTVQYEKLVAGDLTEIKKLELFTGESYQHLLSHTADKKKISQYNYTEHPELLRLSTQNQWMIKLGYTK